MNNFFSKDFEILGEKELPEGHIDILIKEHSPRGYCKKIIVEVKKGVLQTKDIRQIEKYINELGGECVKGVLVANDASKKLLKENKNICIFKYHFNNLDYSKKYTFEELMTHFSIFKL